MISFEKGHAVTYVITIIRYRCPSCGHTHAILPECLFPYRSYSFLFILAVMRDYYTRSLRKVAQKPLKMPDGREILYNYNTFEKWEGLYKKKGMDGLMPKQRSDAGLSRALPDTAIEEIFRLKQQFPRINATLIYTKLIADGFIKQSEVSVSTVQRFIQENLLCS